MPEENDPPQPPSENPSVFGGVSPDEMFARAMQSARMTGGAGAWEPPTIEEAAQLFPGYEVLKFLGRGGMGAVYQARQVALDRLVAIKLLPLEVSVNRDFADRFRREARAMARLHHPKIVTVFDFGETSEGHLFFAMEFVAGANLSEIIHRVGLDADQALLVVSQICTALAYAHGKGVVHRDIKPANVMIDTENHVKVADFGLARLTDGSTTDLSHTTPGSLMGTFDYMAPEQRQGGNVDHRADIYSLGVLLYEMLCRVVPKGAFQPPSARIGCNASIDQIVIKAMQQQPELRYQSTAEMKTDVEKARTPGAMIQADGSTGVQTSHTTSLVDSAENAAKRDNNSPLGAKRGGEIRGRFRGCSFSLMIAFGVAFACWLPSSYFFGHPEKPQAYRFLKKIGKIEAPRRFEVTSAPQGEFLSAQRIFDRYGRMTSRELEELNVQLLRDYIKNYRETKRPVPYLTGDFVILDAYELRKTDMFPSGVVALAQAVGFPQVVIEHVYCSSPRDVPALRSHLRTGLEMKIEKANDLSALLHIERMSEGNIQLTVIPLLYQLKQGVGTVQLEPPAELNLKAGLPVIKKPTLDAGLKKPAD